MNNFTDPAISNLQCYWTMNCPRAIPFLPAVGSDNYTKSPTAEKIE